MALRRLYKEIDSPTINLFISLARLERYQIDFTLNSDLALYLSKNSGRSKPKFTGFDPKTHSKDMFLRRLMHNYGRYILLTLVGSSTLLLSFDWTAETSLISAAALGVLLELFISNLKSKQQIAEDDNYSPQLVPLELRRSAQADD